MIEIVTEDNIEMAGFVYAEAWRKSHWELCDREFVMEHTTSRQVEYIRKEMRSGKVFYLLSEKSPKGIVSVYRNLIGNLFVLPKEQNKGYGTKLLEFAEGLCSGDTTLWVLNTNSGASSLYQRLGYQFNGKRKQLKDDVFELEMVHKIY